MEVAVTSTLLSSLRMKDDGHYFSPLLEREKERKILGNWMTLSNAGLKVAQEFYFFKALTGNVPLPLRPVISQMMILGFFNVFPTAESPPPLFSLLFFP